MPAVPLLQNAHSGALETNPRSARISDALLAIAGEFAEPVAMFSPFPHDSFLQHPRTVHHLIGLAVSGRQSDPDHACAVMNTPRFSEAVEVALETKISGIEGALKKCPPVMFGRDIYRQLRHVIDDKAAMKVLGHADEVDANLIAILHALPSELRLRGVIDHIIAPAEAEVVAVAANPDDNADGHIARSLFARRLAAIGKRKAFWDAVEEELFTRLIVAPKGPPIDHPHVRPVEDVRQLIRLGRRFRNCLRNYAPELAGLLAFYEFDDGEHKAVVSVKPHLVYSGVIEEIGGVDNDDLDNSAGMKVVAAFESAGIVTFDKTNTSRFNDVKFAFDRLRQSSFEPTLRKFSGDIVKLVSADAGADDEDDDHEIGG